MKLNFPGSESKCIKGGHLHSNLIFDSDPSGTNPVV